MSVHNGLKIARLLQGRSRTLLSARVANELVDALNALLTMEVKRGSSDSVLISDNGTVITLRRSDAPTEDDIPSGWFPFKVYVSGANPSSETTDWRTFRVRAGAMLFDGATPINVTGTDGTDADPDNEEAATGTDRFTVADSTANYYVWIEFEYSTGAWSAAIHHGTDPTADGWADYPAFDGHHLLVAHIDTNTYSGDKIAVIRQYVRSDVIFGPLTEICTPSGSKDAPVPMAFQEET
jgi:hypothetical protein